MRYDIRWLSYEEQRLVIDLASNVYATQKSSYPSVLDPKNVQNNPIHAFLTPDHVKNSSRRRILGLFDGTGELVMVVATRTIDYCPVWMISWTISTLRNASFIKAWQQALDHLTKHFESQGLNEFYVVNPVTREATYRKLMSWLRRKYWTFVERTVLANTKPDHGLHWLIIGQHLYQYDINIRRYILRR